MILQYERRLLRGAYALDLTEMVTPEQKRSHPQKTDNLSKVSPLKAKERP